MTVALLCLLLPLLEPGDAWSEWKVYFDKGGILVEERENLRTNVVQTRARVELACKTDELWELITNEEPYKTVMPQTLESRHLEVHPEEGWLVVYQRMDGSPSSDRDYTLLVRYTVQETPEGKRYHRTWTVDNARGPEPKPGAVRVEANDGSWTLTPAPGGRTTFEYVNYFEAGGSVWTLFSNAATRASARDFLRNLKGRFPDR